jgi:hypothetical protein
MLILAQVNFGLNFAGIIGILYLLLAIAYFILMNRVLFLYVF